MKPVDVVIMGAGPNGISAAIGLAKAGLMVSVIEKNPYRKASVDGRGYALSYSTVLYLDEIGVWPLLADLASPIKSILVREKDTTPELTFNPSDYEQDAMGYMVESHELQRALQKSLKGIDIRYETEAVSFEDHPGYLNVKLNTGDEINARLVIAADGKRSATRDKMGITYSKHDYAHPAMVVRVAHEFSHHNRAIEYFLDEGLLALLPLRGNESSVVWCMSPSKAEKMQQAPAEQVEAALYEIFPDYGPIKLISERFTYPLSATLSDQLTRHRLALVGDASQSIHPVAGQGLNLGFRGLKTLYGLVTEAHKLGLDIGSEKILNQYAKEHKAERQKFYRLTDALIHLYDIKSGPLKRLRSVGLGILNRLTPLKRGMINQAMGEKNINAPYLRNRHNRVG